MWLLILILSCVHIELMNCETDNDIISKVIETGDKVILSCPVIPAFLSTYKWVYVREGTNRPQVISSGRQLVVGEPRFSVHINKTERDLYLELHLSDVKKFEAGLFMCWRRGQRPNPQIYLEVHDKENIMPEVISYMGPKKVQYGATANFSCNIIPNTIRRVIWLYNNRSISPVDKLYKQSLTKDGRILKTTLTVASLRRSGTFTCRAFTKPIIDHEFPVEVVVPRVESLFVDPNPDAIQYDDELSLTCTISGTNSQVIWLKDGEVLKNRNDTHSQRYTEYLSDGRVISRLLIRRFRQIDNGQYVCYIPGSSRNVLFNIEGRLPRLLGIYGSGVSYENDFNLTCKTQYDKSYQTTKVIWQFDGKDIDYGQNIKELTELEIHNITSYHLIVSRATPNFTGVYSCRTPFGTASTAIQIFYTSPIPSTSTKAPVKFTTTEANRFRLTTYLRNFFTLTSDKSSSDDNDGPYSTQEMSTTHVPSESNDLYSTDDKSHYPTTIYTDSSPIETETASTDSRTLETDEYMTTQYTDNNIESTYTTSYDYSSTEDDYIDIEDYYYYDGDEKGETWIDNSTQNNIEINNGDTAVLECIVHGPKHMVVLWQKEERKILISVGNIKVTRDERITIGKESKETIQYKHLTITNATIKDSGIYSCIVYASDPNEERWQIRLKVRGSEESTVTEDTQDYKTHERENESDITLPTSVTPDTTIDSITDNEFPTSSTEATLISSPKINTYSKNSISSSFFDIQDSNNNSMYEDYGSGDYESEDDYLLKLKHTTIGWLFGLEGSEDESHSSSETFRSTVQSSTPIYSEEEESSDSTSSSEEIYDSNGISSEENDIGSGDTSEETQEEGSGSIISDDLPIRTLSPHDEDEYQNTTTSFTDLFSSLFGSSTDKDTSFSPEYEDIGSGDFNESNFSHPFFSYDYGMKVNNSLENLDEELLMAHDLLGLPCPVEAPLDEITWKKDDDLLFLGSLDLNGDSGMHVNSKGMLHLTGTETGWYTCYVQHPSTFNEYPIISYFVESKGESGYSYIEVTKEKKFPIPKEYFQTENPLSNVQNKSHHSKSKSNGASIHLISNSKKSGKALQNVLSKEFGIQIDNFELCKTKREINTWDSAYEAVNECKKPPDETLTIINIDFKVYLPPGGWYESILIYNIDKRKDTDSHAYGPLIPSSETNKRSFLEYSSYKTTLEASLGDTKNMLKSF